MNGKLADLRRQLLCLQAGLVSAEATVQTVRGRIAETEDAIRRAEGSARAGDRVVIEDWEMWAGEVAAALRDPADLRVIAFAPGGVEAGEASTPQTRALSRSAFHAAEMGDAS